MRIGIVAEGPADIAVITNVLKGVVGLDSSDIVPIRPRLKFDKTHLAHLDPDSHSTWSLVKQECIEKKKIEEFLALEDSTHIVVHIDTAEAQEYEIIPPTETHHEYCQTLRSLVIKKIDEWLDNKYTDQILYAVAVEEIDAWVLVVFEKRASCTVKNPKRRLQHILTQKKEASRSDYTNYLDLSKPLSKERLLIKERFLESNCSLRLFYEEAKSKLKVTNH